MNSIQKTSVVGLAYKLSNQQGEELDSSSEHSPFSFICGIGQTLPKFDEHLMGLKIGDEFAFELKAKDAYGEKREDQQFKLPKSLFTGPDVPAEILALGNRVPLQDQSGNHFEATIVMIEDQEVIMDANHPLAGVDLYFEGKILSLRPATESELDHGHVHGPGGHHH